MGDAVDTGDWEAASEVTSALQDMLRNRFKPYLRVRPGPDAVPPPVSTVRTVGGVVQTIAFRAYVRHG